jgi:hypothetical protein
LCFSAFTKLVESSMAVGLITSMSAALRGGRGWGVRLTAPKLQLAIDFNSRWSVESAIRIGRQIDTFGPDMANRLHKSLGESALLDCADAGQLKKLLDRADPNSIPAIATDFKSVRGLLLPSSLITLEPLTMSLKNDFPKAYVAIDKLLFADPITNVRRVCIYALATGGASTKAKRLYTASSGQPCELRMAEVDAVVGPILGMMKAHDTSTEPRTMRVNDHASWSTWFLSAQLLGANSAFAVVVTADASEELLAGLIFEVQAAISQAFADDVSSRRGSTSRTSSAATPAPTPAALN